ncbi:MAG: hypothetical protein WB586_16295 [Chthoniobacterales bacterium]
MPLCKFTVTRIVPEDRASFLFGHFVIDTPTRGQEAILCLLSATEIRMMGIRLGIIPDLSAPMPPNMLYELNAFAADPLDLPPRPTFTSESGFKVWVIQESQGGSSQTAPPA